MKEALLSRTKVACAPSGKGRVTKVMYIIYEIYHIGLLLRLSIIKGCAVAQWSALLDRQP